MKQLKVGDPVLVTGFAHFEKAEVVSIDKKGAITLNNRMVIDNHYKNLVRSTMTAEAWDEDKYEDLRSNYLMPDRISSIQRHWKSLKKEDRVALFNKLTRIVEKFNL